MTNTEILQEIVLSSVDSIQEFAGGNKDLEWEPFLQSAGGQHINNYRGDIRVKHIPTGTVVECGVYRSMHVNRNLAALKLLIKLVEDEIRI